MMTRKTKLGIEALAVLLIVTCAVVGVSTAKAGGFQNLAKGSTMGKAFMMAHGHFGHTENGHGDFSKNHAYGEITSIDGETIVIAPKIPEFFKDKMDKHGVKVHIDLPSEMTITVAADTEIYINGEKGSIDDLTVGTEIIVLGPKEGTSVTAKLIGDKSSFMMHVNEKHDKMKQLHSQMGHDFPEGGHPMFGEIAVMDNETLTLLPMIPEFLQAKLDKHEHIEIELPDEMLLDFSDEVRFMIDGEEVTENPFKAGDIVALMIVPGDNGNHIIVGMADQESAKKKVMEMIEKFHGEHDCSGHGFSH